MPELNDLDAGGSDGSDDADPQPLYLVAARLPVDHHPIEGWRRSPGGLVSALEPVLDSVTAWFGQTRPGQPPPPATFGRCRLVEIPMTSADHASAHDGFCNRTLWPALHGLDGNVESSDTWWDAWERHNLRVAELVAETAIAGGAVWAHDYHYFALGAILRRHRPDLRVGLSCHTPVVADVLAGLPRARDLAKRLAGFSLIGVQTESDRAELTRFLDLERPSGRPRPTIIANPVGFDVAAWRARRDDEVVRSLAERHRQPSGVLVVGVDRIDYTKGLLHKLHAIEVILGRGDVGPDDIRFVQIAVPSRTSIPVYAYLAQQMKGTAERINAEFPRSDGRPVVTLVDEQQSPREVAGLMRAGDIALITPARDGMNLVALEYAVLNGDRSCEVVLSRGAGAAEHIGPWCELVDGMDVNAIAGALASVVPTCASASSADRSRRRAVAAARLTADRWSRTFVEHLPARAGAVDPIRIAGS